MMAGASPYDISYSLKTQQQLHASQCVKCNCCYYYILGVTSILHLYFYLTTTLFPFLI